ncbi:MAG: PIG-L family deacetylase [Terriglobia bacterium]|jgi:LmbE family N-acetylglucosaminyl deacetylase
MDFYKSSSEIYVPHGSAAEAALKRTTHMAIGAHPDDNEIMAFHGIVECFGRDDRHFTGVTVTNGAGSARDGIYARYTDEEMQTVRRVEQKKAAVVGEYAAHVFLDYTSGEVKDSKNLSVAEDLKKVVMAARPQVIYTHNLADKHDTHVSVALRTLRALREIPKEARPQRLYGCEVWRSLDWLCDPDKIVFDVQGRENLALSLVGVYDSQICGGKRYDLATAGRRRANATYLASHAVDQSAAVTFAVDLTPLVEDEKLDPAEYILGFIDRFKHEVSTRLAKLG